MKFKIVYFIRVYGMFLSNSLDNHNNPIAREVGIFLHIMDGR